MMQRLAGLNLTPRADAAGKDTNPCTMSEATLYRETLTLASLDPDELEVFKAQFGALLAAPSSDERKIQLDRLSAYIIALRCIKHELGGIKFRGLNPEDTELGFGFIRPRFTYGAVTPAVGAYKNDWNVVFAAVATWIDWLYAGTPPAATAYTIGVDFGFVITHLKSLITPAAYMAECRFEVGRTGILIPLEVRALRVGDTENGTSIISVPTMILKPRSSLYAGAYADHIGTDEIALGGLVFGLGRVLKQISIAPTWV